MNGTVRRLLYGVWRTNMNSYPGVWYGFAFISDMFPSCGIPRSRGTAQSQSFVLWINYLCTVLATVHRHYVRRP